MSVRMSPASRRWVITFALLAVGSCAACGRRPTEVGRPTLIAAAGAVRPVEARLAGVDYAPWRPARPLHAADAGFISLARQAIDRAARWRAARSLAVAGFARLLAGEPDSGELAAAAASGPSDGALLNDLGAVHLAAASPERPLEYLKALVLFDRALDAGAGLPAALFNRALALEDLSLRPAAATAWRAYLAADRASGWAAEARSHLAALAVPDEAQLWSVQRTALVTAARGGGRIEAGTAVHRFPQAARLWG